MYQTNIQSHELSMFGSFRYSTRKGGGEHQQGIELLTDELDNIIETSEDLIKYGANTEFDSMDFAQEMFGRLYGQAELSRENEWSAVHEQLDRIDEIADLQSICKGDPDLAMLSTNYILHTMSEDIGNILREYRSYMENPDSPTNEDGNPDPNEFGLSPASKISMTANGKKLEEIIKDLEASKPLIDAMGDKDAPSGSNHDQNRQHLVKQLMDKDSVLRKIMKIVGRLNNAVNGLQANSLAQEMSDQEITTGKGKFSHLISSEKMYLADDSTVDKFYSRHIKREQFMFRQKGKSKKIGGPITVLIDESGSMDGYRQDIAKSVAAALYAMASQQSRDCIVIGFDSRILFSLKKKKKGKTATLKQRNAYTKEITDMSAVGFIANRSTYGGTNFSIAIKEALMQSKGRNADILFITDGADSIPQSSLQSLNRSKEKDGARIFTILLGVANDSLRSVSDAVLPFGRLTDDSINSLAMLMKSMER